MRKLIASILGAGTLVLAALLVAQPAAVADPDASKACQAGNDFGLSHGACVNLFKNNINGAVVVSVCKQVRQNKPADFNMVFKNLGDCISTFV